MEQGKPDSDDSESVDLECPSSVCLKSVKGFSDLAEGPALKVAIQGL